ncbi:hypothetical protein FALBO_5095 [Fusarium albosuccineum]|uniref:Uncharacterized protein n=1 Tax=Fusarium albosuccineum TaxID=1237068 RepID=A0A8H4LH81_9HYPO|nr:hypothetical protein FALBO_5095 [Fusarium albosuccineum]KAF5007958.1 hypothetical protein FDECE_5727 [Fusarium decemcellulare]
MGPIRAHETRNMGNTQEKIVKHVPSARRLHVAGCGGRGGPARARLSEAEDTLRRVSERKGDPKDDDDVEAVIRGTILALYPPRTNPPGAQLAECAGDCAAPALAHRCHALPAMHPMSPETRYDPRIQAKDSGLGPVAARTWSLNGPAPMTHF